MLAEVPVQVDGQVDETGEPTAAAPEPAWGPESETPPSADVIDADVVQEIEATQPVIEGEEAQPSEADTAPAEGRRRRRSGRTRQGEGRPARKTEAGTAASRARKTVRSRATGRGRARKDTPPAE